MSLFSQGSINAISKQSLFNQFNQNIIHLTGGKKSNYFLKLWLFPSSPHCVAFNRDDISDYLAPRHDGKQFFENTNEGTSTYSKWNKRWGRLAMNMKEGTLGDRHLGRNAWGRNEIMKSRGKYIWCSLLLTNQNFLFFISHSLKGIIGWYK